MAWKHSSGRLGMQPIADVSTVQNHPLGTIVTAHDPDYGEGEFIYLKGATGLRIRDWVTYNVDTFVCVALAANAIGPVGVTMSAIDAATDYGWVQISGKCIGGCKTAFADNARVWITASAGRVDDASVAGDLVNLARGASTTTTGTFVADFEIHRPYVNDNSSSV